MLTSADEKENKSIIQKKSTIIKLGTVIIK